MAKIRTFESVMGVMGNAGSLGRESKPILEGYLPSRKASLTPPVNMGREHGVE